jgi:hypothetical protein
MPPSLRYVTKAPASFETLNAEAVFVKFDIQEFTQKTVESPNFSFRSECGVTNSHGWVGRQLPGAGECKRRQYEYFKCKIKYFALFKLLNQIKGGKITYLSS